MYTSYEPNDSPFGDAYRVWLFHGETSLAVYSRPELDEFASCAYSILGIPAYEHDVQLAQFLSDLEGAAPRC